MPADSPERRSEQRRALHWPARRPTAAADDNDYDDWGRQDGTTPFLHASRLFVLCWVVTQCRPVPSRVHRQSGGFVLRESRGNCKRLESGPWPCSQQAGWQAGRLAGSVSPRLCVQFIHGNDAASKGVLSPGPTIYPQPFSCQFRLRPLGARKPSHVCRPLALVASCRTTAR